ncbi:hypothetical protein AJR20_002595, partial [Shigella dysenteriae]
MKRTMLYLSLLAVSCSVSAAKYPVLTESSPEKAGFNVKRLNQMDRWISQQVDAGYPGVNLLIIKDNQIVYRKAWGAAKKYDGSVLMEQPVKATTGTLYDLASNTKMYATNFALQKLMSEGKLHPDDRIAKYIPGFADSPNDTIKGKNTLRISVMTPT